MLEFMRQLPDVTGVREHQIHESLRAGSHERTHTVVPDLWHLFTTSPPSLTSLHSIALDGRKCASARQELFGRDGALKIAAQQIEGGQDGVPLIVRTATAPAGTHTNDDAFGSFNGDIDSAD